MSQGCRGLSCFYPEGTRARAFAPGSRILRWSTAGHPPPLLLAPDGSSRLLQDHDGAPLDELCDTLLSRLVGATEDDVALIAVRGYPEERSR